MKITLTLGNEGTPFFRVDSVLVETPAGLKAIRKQDGLSTKQLAEICGVSARTVEDWEQGRRSPSKSAMMLLAAWLEKQEK